MKIVVNGRKKTEVSFPCLMKIKDPSDVIVYMTGKKENWYGYNQGYGVVVSSTSDTYMKEGFYSGLWPLENFEVFNGSITLEND